MIRLIQKITFFFVLICIYPIAIINAEEGENNIKYNESEIINILNNIHIYDIGRSFSIIENYIKTGHGKIVRGWLEKNKFEFQSGDIWKEYFIALTFIYDEGKAEKKLGEQKLRTLIADYDEFWPARLALADFFNDIGIDEQANHHYDILLLDNNIKDAEKNIIRNKKFSLSQKRTFTSSLWFNFLTSTNINRGSEKEYVLINNLPFRLNDSKIKESGQGVQVGSYSRLLLLNKNKIRLEFTTNLYGSKYENKIFDSLSIYPKLELSYFINDKKSKIGYYLFSHHYWINAENQTNSLGVGINYSTAIGNNKSFYGNFSVENQENEINSNYDLVNFKLYSQLQFSFFSASQQWLYYLQEHKESPLASLTHSNHQIGVGVYKEFNKDLAASFNASRGIRRYKGKHALIDDSRTDINYSIGVDVVLRSLGFFGFSPKIKLNYYNNDSNVDIENFDGFEYGFEFTRKY